MRAFSLKRSSNSLKSLTNYYKPKSYNQEQYCDFLNDSRIKLLFAIGPAGTGKTMLACNTAIKELQSGNINKIVLTRPVVPVEEDIGFLPGNINKKMDPWTRPIFDIFLEFYSQKDIDAMIHNNVIEISPLGYMRGRTFKNSFIIADEMQNSSPNQMLMLTTRIGVGSKMIVTGDLKQSDKGQESGLYDFIRKFNLYEQQNALKNENTNYTINTGIKIVEMNNTDIERSPIIVKILDIYNVKPTPPPAIKVQQVLQPTSHVQTSVYLSNPSFNHSSNSSTNTTTTTTTKSRYYKGSNQKYDNDCAMIPRSESWLKD
jgi:phosphate starvation-inducible PhoH-like protein